MAINIHNLRVSNMTVGPLSGGGNGGGGGSSLPIETSGLQLFLDAANTTSYSGTGNTWTDLSGNGNDFTGGAYSGTSTPTFVSNGDASYFQFQESSGTLFSANSTTPSDYGFGGTPDDFTISFWANPNSLTSGVHNDNEFWFNFSYGYTRTDNGLVITGGSAETSVWQMARAGSNRSQNDLFRLSAFEAGRGLDNNWYNVASDAGNWTNYTFVSEVDSSNGMTALLYVNGSATSYTETLSLRTSVTISNIDYFVIGGSVAGTSDYMWNGKLANLALYNRALPASEVLSNYNALSSRF